LKGFTTLLGIGVSTDSARAIVHRALSGNKSTVINTINPHSYVEQKYDSAFRQALTSSDFLIPDGSGIVLAARILHGISLRKIAGFDLFSETMRQLDEHHGSVFFLGSSDSVLNLILARAAVDYPNVKVTTHSPAFKTEFSTQDVRHFADEILASKTDVVFVGLTAPKQEKLIYRLKHLAPVRMYSGIGAVFDFYAGVIVRPNDIWIKLHLEWFIRLIGEPRRLWRRNFVSTPLFLWDLVKCFLTKR